MVGLHRLSGNVCCVTGLFHLSEVGVNAGFVITKNSIIHIDAGMTVADGDYLLVQSRKKAKNKENFSLF
jgi:predicted metal-dependent RNase